MTPERLEELMRGEPTTEQGLYGEGAVKRIALAACREERYAALSEAAELLRPTSAIHPLVGGIYGALLALRDKEQP